MGQLNELQIKAAAPRDKEYLLADGEVPMTSELARADKGYVQAPFSVKEEK